MSNGCKSKQTGNFNVALKWVSVGMFQSGYEVFISGNVLDNKLIVNERMHKQGAEWDDSESTDHYDDGLFHK